MCELCDIVEMFGKVRTIEIWMQVKRLGDKYDGLWFKLPTCDKVEPYSRAYWQGVYHTLNTALRYPDWLKETRERFAVGGVE